MSFFNIVAATNEDTVVAAYEPSKVRSDSYQSEAEPVSYTHLPAVSFLRLPMFRNCCPGWVR